MSQNPIMSAPIRVNRPSLIESDGEGAVRENARRLREAGYSEEQAWRIARDTQRRNRRVEHPRPQRNPLNHEYQGADTFTAL